MAFPEDVLGIKVELYYDGQWNIIDPMSDVRGMGAEDGEIKLGTRGQPDESTTIRATIADLSINNRNGKYSPRNIRSSLYGKLGQNTKLRIAADLTTDLSNVTDSFNDDGTNGWPVADSGHTYTTTGGNAADYLVSAGLAYHRQAAVDTLHESIVDDVFVIDFDCTIEGVQLEAVPTAGNVHVVLRGRMSGTRGGPDEALVQGRATFTTANTIVGVVSSLKDGTLIDSTIETATGLAATDLVSIRTQAFGRKVRMKIWETGTTQPSTWLITQEVNCLTPGEISLQSFLEATVSNALPYDITFQSIDYSLGMILYVGEVAEWPKKWDSTGNDVWTSIRPSGLTRRKIQGNKPLGSALSRALSALDLVGYWSFENLAADISGAYQSMPSTYPGVGALSRIGSDFGTDYGTPKIDWGGDRSLSGSDPLPVISSSITSSESLVYKAGTLIPVTDTTSDSYTIIYWVNSKIGEDQTTEQTLTTLRVYVANSEIASIGLIAGYQVNVSGIATISVTSFAFDSSDVLIDFQTGPEIALVEGWHAIKATFTTPSAGNVNWSLSIDDISTTTGTFAVSSNTAGYPWGTAEFAALSTESSLSIAVGHYAIATGVGSDPIDDNFDYLLEAATGHNGETATDRLTRLCSEEGVTLELNEDENDSGTRLGPQKSLNFVKMLEQIAAAEGGLLGELRYDFGYEYTTRRALYNRTNLFTLDYSNADLAEVPEATDDDQRVLNRFTSNLKYNRDDVGVEVTATKTEGPLSVNEPDDATLPGAGLYDDGDDFNLYSYSQLADFSGWRVHLGTWDETRYPDITVHMHRTQFSQDLDKLAAAVIAEAGDTFLIENLPVWLTPGDLELQVRAVSMRLSNFNWDIKWVTLPAGPWSSVATVSSDKAEIAGSNLIVTVDDNDTELVTYTGEVFDDNQKTRLWTESAASLPIDFRIDVAHRAGGRGGEKVRAESGATRITPYAYDGFNRTVSNGWGTPDLGGTYTTYGSGGVITAADYNVAPSAGTIRLAAAGNVRGIYLDDVNLQDCRAGFTWQCPIPTGDPLTACATFRSGRIQVRLSVLQFAAKQIVLEVWDTIDVVLIDSFGALNFVDYVTAKPIRMMCNVEDTTIQVAVWAPNTMGEPLFWSWVTQYDSVTPSSGWFGVEVQSGSFNTNVNPTFSISDLTIDNPQRIAVTRAMEGVSREWAVGSDVRLWDTPILGR